MLHCSIGLASPTTDDGLGFGSSEMIVLLPFSAKDSVMSHYDTFADKIQDRTLKRAHVLFFILYYIDPANNLKGIEETAIV